MISGFHPDLRAQSPFPNGHDACPGVMHSLHLCHFPPHCHREGKLLAPIGHFSFCSPSPQLSRSSQTWRAGGDKISIQHFILQRSNQGCESFSYKRNVLSWIPAPSPAVPLAGVLLGLHQDCESEDRSGTHPVSMKEFPVWGRVLKEILIRVGDGWSTCFVDGRPEFSPYH